MYVANVNTVPIGQVILEPVLSDSGVLLCNPGTPMSRTLKQRLIKFGVNNVTVESIMGEKIDTEYLNFQAINNMAYLNVRSLNIKDITKCAHLLVDSLVKDEGSLLLNTLYEYDKGTYNHSINVASLSLTCAIKLGWSIKELHILSLGCLVHDIGKTMIPIEILNKNGKLTKDEVTIMRKHPEYGVAILDKSGETSGAVKEIVLQHHENHDGSGYPRNLSDYHIYKLARLVHIADCYEALCAKRPYKDSLPREEVRAFMLEEATNMFDPILLRKFLESIPMYLIGEEIEFNGVKGVILDITDSVNPLVSVNKDIIRLSDFQNVKYTKNVTYDACRELIYR